MNIEPLNFCWFDFMTPEKRLEVFSKPLPTKEVEEEFLAIQFLRSRGYRVEKE